MTSWGSDILSEIGAKKKWQFAREELVWRLERSEKEEDGILLALLKKEVWSFVTTWMNLEDMAT